MFGNYIVNDDWIFIRQIEAFNHNIFKLSAEIDPSFILQGYLGYFWSMLFGDSIISLQILTFFITLLGLIGFIKILRSLKISRNIQLISSLLYLFNPIILSSAFSFMTDNFFLTFLVWGIYFFLKYYENKQLKTLIIACIFVILSTLIRQIGVLVGISFIGVSLLSTVKKYRKNNKSETKIFLPALLVILSIILSLGLTYAYPRFGINRTTIRVEQLTARLYLLVLSLPYFMYFLFPLLITINSKLKPNIKNYYLVFIPTFIMFFTYLLNFDFFPVGNVFYLEELYTKSDFRSNFSIFDNVFFKIPFATLLGYVYANFIAKVFLTAKDIKPKVLIKKPLNKELLFLAINAIVYLLILLVSSDFYDRYLIPSFIFVFLIFLNRHKDNIKITKNSVICLILFIFISFLLELEFSNSAALKYVQAEKLQKATGYVSQISLNDTYLNYAISKDSNDYTGLIERKSFEYKCYIQQYTLDGDSILLKQAQNLEDYVHRQIVSNPKPYKSNKKQIPRIKNHLDELVYNQEYFSPIYNLVGKHAYVGSWCIKTNL